MLKSFIHKIQFKSRDLIGFKLYEAHLILGYALPLTKIARATSCIDLEAKIKYELVRELNHLIYGEIDKRLREIQNYPLTEWPRLLNELRTDMDTLENRKES